MAARKQKANGKKPKAEPAAQLRSAFRSALIGTVFNMAATTATCGSVLLCLVVAKHFA
jgi:hypothetical protein